MASSASSIQPRVSALSRGILPKEPWLLQRSSKGELLNEQKTKSCQKTRLFLVLSQRHTCKLANFADPACADAKTLL